MSLAERGSDRIAGFVGRGGEQQMRRRRDGAAHLVRRRCGVERQHLDAAGGLRRPRCPDDAVEARAELGDVDSARNSRARGRAASPFRPSRLRERGPFLAHGGIGFAFGRAGVGGEPRRIEPGQRPHRGAAHQRRGVVEQPLGFARQRGVAGVADRDQHIADEAVAPGALHRRLREQRAEARIVELRQLGKLRRAQALARGSFASRPACAYLFQGHTARQSSQP